RIRLNVVCLHKSEPPGNADERVDVVGSPGDAQVDAGVELNVPCQTIGNAQIHRANPVRVRLGADGPEKFRVSGEVADDIVAESNGIQEVRVVPAPACVSNDVQLRHQSQAPTGR